MNKRDREKEIKTLLFKLEELVLKAEKETQKCKEEYDGEGEEYRAAEAFEDGVFQAFSICKNNFE